jgi:hypothetical protein
MMGRTAALRKGSQNELRGNPISGTAYSLPRIFMHHHNM